MGESGIAVLRVPAGALGTTLYSPHWWQTVVLSSDVANLPDGPTTASGETNRKTCIGQNSPLKVLPSLLRLSPRLLADQLLRCPHPPMERAGLERLAVT